MEYQVFGCPWSSMVNDYFKNHHPNGNSIIENVEIKDINPETLASDNPDKIKHKPILALVQ